MKTYTAKPETTQHRWFLVDANGKTLGRLASEIARRLRGKHKAEYTPHTDVGDYVVVINSEKVKVTGNKAKDKVYYSHSGQPGKLKTITLDKMLVKNPTMPLQKAVTGMMPKGPLGRAMLRKLKLYVGIEHPHTAQQPEILNIDEA